MRGRHHKGLVKRPGVNGKNCPCICHGQTAGGAHPHQPCWCKGGPENQWTHPFGTFRGLRQPVTH